MFGKREDRTIALGTISFLAKIYRQENIKFVHKNILSTQISDLINYFSKKY